MMMLELVERRIGRKLENPEKTHTPTSVYHKAQIVCAGIEPRTLAPEVSVLPLSHRHYYNLNNTFTDRETLNVQHNMTF